MNRLARILDVFDGSLERYFSKKWHWAITIPALILIYIGLYFLFCFSSTVYVNNGYRSEACKTGAGILFGFVICASILYLVLEGVCGKLTGRKTAWAAMAIATSFLSLWGFDAALNLSKWHHDASALGSGNHWSIIYDIFATGKVPAAKMNNQYYQPKFYHFIIAKLMSFNGIFVHLGNGPVTSNASVQARYSAYTISAYHQLEMTRVFMILLGIASFYAIYRIFKGLGLQGRKVGLATLLTVLIPEFWYIQFFMNNDGLAVTLALWALALALEFKRSEKTLPLLASAVCLGLAMMAKLNSALMAVPMAVIFLYVLAKRIKARKENPNGIWQLVGQFAFFAVIVFPLGLWTPIVYSQKYGIPFGYVLDLTPTQEAKEAYGMFIDPTFYSFFERCILFPARDLFVNVFNMRWRTKVDGVYVNAVDTIDFNCWTAMFKTFMFDEWGNFSREVGVVQTALLSGFLYVEVFFALFALLSSIAYLVRFFVKKLYRNESFVPVVLLVTGLTFAINYVYFVNRYPVGCSQNARYVMPLILVIQCGIASMCVDGIDIFRKLRASSK